uniref:BED-type domain-containing protein n=1 Tax=Pyramimonas obovata TaxID=1411642 RepID=A0A7S0N612_9CHLO|mmetsp:Transcript_19859/g.43446  ORF Transcript_19859/g.43446 Transcript_19859/m.43446 type:complete len:344 (+) Transcript_19859:108-1139(+)
MSKQNGQAPGAGFATTRGDDVLHHYMVHERNASGYIAECNYCSKICRGAIFRLQVHLAGYRGYGIAACSNSHNVEGFGLVRKTWMAYFENGEGNPNALSKRLMAQAQQDRSDRPKYEVPVIGALQGDTRPSVSQKFSEPGGRAEEDNQVGASQKKRNAELDRKWAVAFTANGIPMSVSESEEFREAIRATCEHARQGGRYEVFQKNKTDPGPSQETRLDSLVSIAQMYETVGPSSTSEERRSTKPSSRTATDLPECSESRKNSCNSSGKRAPTLNGDNKRTKRKKETNNENGDTSYDHNHQSGVQKTELEEEMTDSCDQSKVRTGTNRQGRGRCRSRDRGATP